jgi:hypothetical protein
MSAVSRQSWIQAKHIYNLSTFISNELVFQQLLTAPHSRSSSIEQRLVTRQNNDRSSALLDASISIKQGALS